MTKMTRAMREEFYDVCTRKCMAKRKAGKSDLYAPKGQHQSIASETQRRAMFAEIDRRTASKRLQKARRKATARGRQLGFDPKKKKGHKRRKGSAWLTFVKQHKHMRTSKGLLDLKAISKLWKLKKAKLRGKKR